jgi:hypothetical protein
MSTHNSHPVVAVVDLGSDPATALLVVTHDDRIAIVW